MGRRKEDRLIVFDDAWSLLHAFLGALTRYLSFVGLWWVALAILVLFVLWETIEQERYYYKLADFIEFLIGYVALDIPLQSMPPR